MVVLSKILFASIFIINFEKIFLVFLMKIIIIIQLILIKIKFEGMTSKSKKLKLTKFYVK